MTTRNIVVIGGVAAGMSAASQAKRRQPNANVIVFERSPHVSYGACGMPYNIEDPSRDMSDLVVVSAERFRAERGIDVRTETEVVGIDPGAKRVRVRDLAAGRDYDQPYDALVIATGASAIRPPIPGLDLPGVFVLRQLVDGVALERFLSESDARRAVIVGAGYIGAEMAEALATRGLAVTVIEMLDQVVPGFDPAIADLVRAELESHSVDVRTSARVERVEGHDGAGVLVQTTAGPIPADIVLVSVGVRPNVALAVDAGVALGPTGAIAVDDHMRTNVPGVYAAGDCAEAHHLVTGQPTYIPLGTTSNKQGKVAGANAAGADARFGGIVGTAGFKVFDLEVARTGLGQADVERLGLDVVVATSTQNSRGHGFPGGDKLTSVLYADRETGALLGAQMAGRDPVATRVDVFATALHAGMTVADIERLDLAYAPPFAPVYDPILIAATVANKAVVKARRETRESLPAPAA